MKRWHLLTLLLIGLMVGIVPAAAQDSAFALGDGYSITIPDGYEIRLDADGFFILEDRNSEIWIFTPTQLQEVVSHTQNVGGDYIVEELAELTETDLTSDITDLDIADRDGAIAEWSDGVMIALEMRDLFYGVIWSAGTVDDATLESLVESFNGRLNAGAPNDLGTGTGSSGKGGDEAGGGSEGSTGGSSGDCTVSVTTRDTARLRVGPGENRGAIAFLPVGVDVSVTGSFEEADGDIWYQLDKQQAMPGTSANELWVSADEVDASGGCDSVGSASAPPVIPGQAAPPPVTGGEGGSGGSGGGTEIVGGAIPLSGNWRVNWNSTTNASCQGGQNVPIPTVEFLGDISYSTYVAVRGDGSSFTNGGDTYTRTGPNSYFGTFDFGGENAQLYINVVNSRSMNGSATGNFNIDGIACSYTTTFSMSYG